MANSIIELVVSKLVPSEVIGEYIDIRKKGANCVAVCPFHDDTNPSLSISDTKKIFKCFVCDTGGNVITFVSEFEKIPYRSALKKLADKAGIEHSISDAAKPQYDEQTQKLIDVQNEAQRFFQYQLNTPAGAPALKYLRSRHLEPADIERFGIGYAPPEGLGTFLRAKDFDQAMLMNASLVNERGYDFFRDRIIFVVHNVYNDAIGFSGRKIASEGPKYLNSTESRVFKKNAVLYNLGNALPSIKKLRSVYLCEGFMDVIALVKAGFPNALGVMGTALTVTHLKLFRQIVVNLVFDRDVAGIAATLKAVLLLLENNYPVKVITFSGAKDAGELLQSKGLAALKVVLSQPLNAFDFVREQLQTGLDLTNVDNQKRFLTRFGRYLAYADELEQSHNIRKLVVAFKVSEQAIKAYIPARQAPPATLVAPPLQPPPPLPGTPEPPVISRPAPQPIQKPLNYSYVLIKSLVRNPQLLEYFQFNRVYFYDVTAMHIAKYLASKKGPPENAPGFPDYWKKINTEISDDVIIDSKDKLEEVIDYINERSNRATVQKMRLRVKNSKTSAERTAHLSALQKFQRKKGGY